MIQNMVEPVLRNFDFKIMAHAWIIRERIIGWNQKIIIWSNEFRNVWCDAMSQ